MIHRQNWLDVKDYLKYQTEVKQVATLSARAEWGRLRHLILWAADKPFGRAATMRPTFPAYAEGLRTNQGRLISASTLSGIFKTCRAFLLWAKRENPTRYKRVTVTWIESLRPTRGRSEQAELHTREIYTLEDILRLMAVPARTTAARRLRAGVAFLFLSGMRIGAFVTLPLDCVNLDQLTVMQLPGRGVRTKNSKAAKTYLLNIPELLAVVREWDAEIRAALPADAYWFAHLDHWGELTSERPKGKDRLMIRSDFREKLTQLCELAGVPYRSPHKLRHGFAVYALKRTQTMAQLKAVSQNLMHSTIGITDGIYGRLVDDDVRSIITGL